MLSRSAPSVRNTCAARTLLLADEAQQEVFGVDGRMPQQLGFLPGQIDDPLHLLGQLHVLIPVAFAARKSRLDRGSDALQRDPDLLDQDNGAGAIGELEQAQEQMFRTDVVIAEACGLSLAKKTIRRARTVNLDHLPSAGFSNGTGAWRDPCRGLLVNQPVRTGGKIGRHGEVRWCQAQQAYGQPLGLGARSGMQQVLERGVVADPLVQDDGLILLE